MNYISPFLWGQSITGLILQQHRQTLIDEIAAGGFGTVRVDGYCIGGSAAVKDHTPPGDLGRWWWDITKTGQAAFGPLLAGGGPFTGALALLSYWRARGIRYGVCVAGLGEGDSVWGLPASVAADPAEQAKYEAAMRQIHFQLRKSCNPEDYRLCHAMQLHIGRRIYPATVQGVQAIRETQCKLDASSPDLSSAPAVYDLPLIYDETGASDSHPTFASMDTYTRRLARAIRRRFGDTSLPALPEAAALTVAGADVLEVRFADTGSPLSQPSRPYGFAVRSGGVVYGMGDLAYEWIAADRLQLRTPQPLAAGAVEVLQPLTFP